jgi:hypothetical protein
MVGLVDLSKATAKGTDVKLVDNIYRRVIGVSIG